MAISKCVMNYDSIRHLDSKYNHEDAYIIKILECKKGMKEITFSITSIINGNILENLKPFYYTYVDGDLIIITVDNIPDTSLIGKQFYLNDSSFKTKTEKKYLIYDFNNYGLVHTPELAIYNIKLKKLKKNVKVRYFLVNPIGLAPVEYRPIVKYNVNKELDKFYYVYPNGEIPLRGKSPFEKHQNIDDMYDHEFEGRFDKTKEK